MNGSEDWLGRWREGRTGWHEERGNAALQEYWPPLPAGTRVLVPLCGKSVDMLWLANRGLEVVGVELSALAIEAFFAEHAIAFDIDDSGALTRYRAVDRPVTLYCGDYFELACEPCAALFDRGALVALPESLRPAYARHTDSLLTSSAVRLLVTLEYDQQRASGPPFAVTAEEVQRYWPHLQRISVRDDIADAPPKFRAAGLTELLEVVWRSR
ncbi:thiopurine S-methyltransferase [Woeseia oceani]|uniref:Thiopurine S-methyltransferase n=1 Tax=Woeseia oceani TaxID=1548547 RepID=A0A193LCW0_9GAMM|nr:thiopurine S-methyltransferase [Woeseia oceani]ANO50298.1 hypothetical protein BA177_02860 [Woeseia oceani]